MSNYNQPQDYPQAVYPVEAKGGNMVPPPSMATYPVKDSKEDHPPPNTQSRGNGFWRGCCAGMCCCCLLDACF